MDKQKILLIIDSLEVNLKLLRLELDGSSDNKEEIQEQPNNTISLRELIGKMAEDDYEPDYLEVD